MVMKKAQKKSEGRSKEIKEKNDENDGKINEEGVDKKKGSND